MTTKTTEELPEDVTAEEVAFEEAASEDAASEKSAPEKTSERSGPEGAAAETGRRPRLSAGMPRRLVVAALALVFLTAVATAGIQWRESGRLADRDRTEQQVRTRSAEFARTLLAYRHTDLSTSQKRIRELTSSDFGNSYETAFSGLAQVIAKYQADATATVRETYVNDFDGGRAKTLVVLDSEVHSTVGVRRVLGTKLLLELVLEKGSWRVDAMSTLPADDETLTKPDGTVEQGDANSGATTPTTQPTP